MTERSSMGAAPLAAHELDLRRRAGDCEPAQRLIPIALEELGNPGEHVSLDDLLAFWRRSIDAVVAGRIDADAVLDGDVEL